MQKISSVQLGGILKHSVVVVKVIGELIINTISGRQISMLAYVITLIFRRCAALNKFTSNKTRKSEPTSGFIDTLGKSLERILSDAVTKFEITSSNKCCQKWLQNAK